MNELTKTAIYSKIPKFLRKFLYTKQISSQRATDEIQRKYSFALDAFSGVFGNYSWIDNDLMIAHKQVSDTIKKENIIELSDKLRDYGFSINITQINRTYKVMMRPNDNITQYLRTRTLAYDEANHGLIMKQIAPEKSFIID